MERNGSREMRESAACIVAHLAGDIHLAQFPGAIRCISSLLQGETTRTYLWNCSQQQGIHSRRSRPQSISEALMPIYEKGIRKRMKQKFGHVDDVQQKHQDNEAGGGCNELILQGLTIPDRLALDHQNCVDMCTSPGLLTKITAHLYSPTLIQDIKANGPWVDLVNGTFTVLSRLICAPDEAYRRLRQDIFTNERSVTNLERTLELWNEAEHRELQISAMEILTELASDSSINLTVKVKESLIRKLLQIFLADEEGGSCAAKWKKLKATAGRTLEFLLANSELSSAIVNDSLGPLTEILDANNNIMYRTIAAKILGNLCALSDVDKKHVKETLMPKVLRGILPKKTEQTQRRKKKKNESTQGGDVENQTILADQNMSSTDQEEDEQTGRKELQEALLFLILVIYEKVICADNFKKVEKKEDPGLAAFVTGLKTIVEENCEETIISLRIVKLCGQIARSMMKRNQYIEQFRNKEFVNLLSQAKKIMSNLESCVLFAGTDRHLKKVTRPLLSELEKELKQ